MDILMGFVLPCMKYKPVTHKLKPPHQVVNHAKHVLLLLLDGGKGTNEIFLKGRQTGLTSYKRDVLDAIKTLQQAELIDEIPDPDHSQRRIKQLTPLGKELTKLMENIESYNKSYWELYDVMVKNFGINWSNIKDDFVLANILRDKKWTEDEIAEFIIIDKYKPRAIHEFQCNCPWPIILTVLAKYSVLVDDYKPNQIAKIIMNKFIIDIVTEQLSSILENVTVLKRESMLENITNNIIRDVRYWA